MVEYNKRIEAIKKVIIKLLFEDRKPIVTEVTIKKEVDCYNVNIQRVVLDINSLNLYPYISYSYNSYGVLNLLV